MRRIPSREELSRTLVAYGAFTSASKILEEPDRTTLAHLRKLRKKLQGERGEAVDRVIHNLRALMAKGSK